MGKPQVIITGRDVSFCSGKWDTAMIFNVQKLLFFTNTMSLFSERGQESAVVKQRTGRPSPGAKGDKVSSK